MVVESLVWFGVGSGAGIGTVFGSLGVGIEYLCIRVEASAVGIPLHQFAAVHVRQTSEVHHVAVYDEEPLEVGNGQCYVLRLC